MESKSELLEPAADMIRDGQVVLIDGGTTNLELLPYLSRERSATMLLTAHRLRWRWRIIRS